MNDFLSQLPNIGLSHDEDTRSETSSLLRLLHSDMVLFAKILLASEGMVSQKILKEIKHGTISMESHLQWLHILDGCRACVDSTELYFEHESDSRTATEFLFPTLNLSRPRQRTPDHSIAIPPLCRGSLSEPTIRLEQGVQVRKSISLGPVCDVDDIQLQSSSDALVELFDSGAFESPAAHILALKAELLRMHELVKRLHLQISNLG